MMASIVFIATVYFILGLCAKRIFQTVINELEEITEGIKKASELADSKAER